MQGIGEKTQSWRTCPTGAATRSASVARPVSPPAFPPPTLRSALVGTIRPACDETVASSIAVLASEPTRHVERTVCVLHLGGPDRAQFARIVPSQSLLRVGGGPVGRNASPALARRTSPSTSPPQTSPQPWAPLEPLSGRSSRGRGAVPPAPNLRGVAAYVRVRRDASNLPSRSAESWTSFSVDPVRRARDKDRPLVSDLPGAAAATPSGCGAALSSQAWVSSPSSLCRRPRKHGPSSVLPLSGAAALRPRGRGAVPLEQPWTASMDVTSGGEPCRR